MSIIIAKYNLTIFIDKLIDGNDNMYIIISPMTLVKFNPKMKIGKVTQINNFIKDFHQKILYHFIDFSIDIILFKMIG